MNPLGGLPRRKKVLEKELASREGLKPIVLDSGNALFRAPGLDDTASTKRAKFILETMGALGTQAMAVGERDMGPGLQFLKDIAKGSSVKLLSANLRDPAGKPVFEPSTVIISGKWKVGVIGASPVSLGIPPLVAVTEEVKKLKGKVDVLVVLAAMPYADSLQLSTELKTQVDFVLQSGDSRQTPAQLSEGNVVIGSGERGRAVGKLELTLGGKGAWVNLDQAAMDKQLLDGLDARIAELKERRKGITDKKALADFDATLKDFDARRVELLGKAKAGTAPGSRAFRLGWVALDASVGDDEPLKAKVLAYEPGYAAPH
jgi:2',3'-cyclic-nucleotide 2'-phosphodiesterase (5'-nucleotidase family)